MFTAFKDIWIDLDWLIFHILINFLSESCLLLIDIIQNQQCNFPTVLMITLEFEDSILLFRLVPFSLIINTDETDLMVTFEGHW